MLIHWFLITQILSLHSFESDHHAWSQLPRVQLFFLHVNKIKFRGSPEALRDVLPELLDAWFGVSKIPYLKMSPAHTLTPSTYPGSWLPQLSTGKAAIPRDPRSRWSVGLVHCLASGGLVPQLTHLSGSLSLSLCVCVCTPVRASPSLSLCRESRWRGSDSPA